MNHVKSDVLLYKHNIFNELTKNLMKYKILALPIHPPAPFKGAGSISSILC
jgi:hypothetical protein